MESQSVIGKEKNIEIQHGKLRDEDNLQLCIELSKKYQSKADEDFEIALSLSSLQTSREENEEEEDLKKAISLSLLDKNIYDIYSSLREKKDFFLETSVSKNSYSSVVKPSSSRGEKVVMTERFENNENDEEEEIKKGILLSLDPQEQCNREHREFYQLVTSSQRKSKTTGPRILVTTSLKKNYRPIVIDGSNVGWSHGLHRRFSAKGLQIAHDHFRKLGHDHIVIFVRSYENLPRSDSIILDTLHEMGVLIHCPESRTISGKHISYYDDLMIIDYAVRVKGIVISADRYDDIINYNKDFKEQIKNRLLTYRWVKDEFMLPQDPHGRHGPSLLEFLRK